RECLRLLPQLRLHDAALHRTSRNPTQRDCTCRADPCRAATFTHPPSIHHFHAGTLARSRRPDLTYGGAPVAGSPPPPLLPPRHPPPPPTDAGPRGRGPPP